jgi:hypothetical protein
MLQITFMQVIDNKSTCFLGLLFNALGTGAIACMWMLAVIDILLKKEIVHRNSRWCKLSEPLWHDIEDRWSFKS